MKVQFKITCETYLEAGMVEEFCQKHSLGYTEMALDGSMSKPSPAPSKKRTSRVKKIQGEHISEILNAIKMFPNYSNGKISEHVSFPVSANVVSQVRRGKHPLSPRKASVKAIK